MNVSPVNFGAFSWVVNLAAIAGLVAAVVIQVAFAVGVYLDAKQETDEGRLTVIVGPFIWTLTTLFGGVFVAVAYWLMHHSTLAERVNSGHQFSESSATATVPAE